MVIYSGANIRKASGISKAGFYHVINKPLSDDIQPDIFDQDKRPYWTEEKAKLFIDRLKKNKNIHPRLKRIY